MGFYIQTPQAHNKARQMVDIHKAELVLSPEKFDFNGPNALLCVVENPLFDAIAIAYSSRERDEFNDPTDQRPKTWLKIPKTLALKLNPECPLNVNPPTNPT